MANNRKQPGKGKGKKKSPPQQHPQPSRPSGAVRSSSGGFRRLDGPAAAYARLLLDPCNGKLTHPVHQGAEFGYLARFEKIVDVGTGATATAGVVTWWPGNIGTPDSSGQNTGLAVAFEAANGNVSVSPIWIGDQMPGYSFINANANTARPVAACLEVLYPGTELNRAGLVGLGLTPGITTTWGGATTANTVMTVLPTVLRTPDSKLEAVWVPALGDTVMNAKTAPVTNTQVAERNALTFAWTGQTPGVGFKLKFTVIYEYTFSAPTGIVFSPADRNTSRNSLREVLDEVMTVGSKHLVRLGRLYLASKGSRAGRLGWHDEL